MAAVDVEGRLRWERRLGTGFWSGALWGDVLVARGPGARGATALKGYVDGRRAWTVDCRAFPALGLQPRTNSGLRCRSAESYLVPAPSGVVAIDPQTGASTRLDSTVAVEQVLPVGEHVVVRTRTALFVVRPARSVGGPV